jgi:hypothetical protein
MILNRNCTRTATYYSNQNQYFLHGLANAGHGFLGDDWLANSADPTPIFSLLVAGTARFLHPWAFHVSYAILFGIYFTSLVGIFSCLAGERDTWKLRLVFMAVLVVLHSAAARWASQRLFGLDYPWYFQAGVAGQYVLGGMFQPSTFGVLLLLAIWLFIGDRRRHAHVRVHGQHVARRPAPAGGAFGRMGAAARAARNAVRVPEVPADHSQDV